MGGRLSRQAPRPRAAAGLAVVALHARGHQPGGRGGPARAAQPALLALRCPRHQGWRHRSAQAVQRMRAGGLLQHSLPARRLGRPQGGVQGQMHAARSTGPAHGQLLLCSPRQGMLPFSNSLNITSIRVWCGVTLHLVRLITSLAVMQEIRPTRDISRITSSTYSHIKSSTQHVTNNISHNAGAQRALKQGHSALVYHSSHPQY